MKLFARPVCAAGLLVALFLLSAVTALAQSSGITDDDVNDIAKKMYCPVCENIPLDVCPTQACKDWRAEIRAQLERGESERQIIDSFVARYGERVIGTPQDPSLRALSLLTPWLIGLAALAAAAITFVRWRSNQRQASQRAALLPDGPHMEYITDDDYRARLEKDLKARR